ncbi:MAG: hypothetical protein AB9873_05670 [Syntrophobacteraceae bacterium]
MNFRQKVVIGIMDVLMIAELCVSMYLANQDQANFTPVFLKSFVVMVVPTLIAARIAVKWLRTVEPEPVE